MPTVTIEEAQVRLPELIGLLVPGEEIVITRQAHPVARLMSPLSNQPHPVFGRGRGKVVVVSEDEDHLADFKEYMP